MPNVHLDLSALRDFDERALGALYEDIAKLPGVRLAPDQVRRMYAEGLTVVLTGYGLSREGDLSYALYYRRISFSYRTVLTLACYTGSRQPHEQVMRQDRPERLIVAGTLNHGRFSGLSTTWVKLMRPGSGRHALGMFMNGVLLAAYGVEGVASLAPASAWCGAAS
ncbi:MAG: hypothetical protein JW820_06335 [Spirochaetales bacterium]|nr:hypothetical protein [Spirochaetales bacterium]